MSYISYNTPTSANVGPCKFGTEHTRMPFNGSSGNAGASNYTIATEQTAEGPFDYVRFIYQNYSTAATATITSAAVAPSSTMGDGMNPTNYLGAADPTLWVPVTFNNGGLAGDVPSPAAPSGGPVRSVTIPAGVQGTLNGGSTDIVCGQVFSDWVECHSLARLDTDPSGTTLPLVMARSYAAGLQNLIVNGGVLSNYVSGQPFASNGYGWDTYANGRIIRSFAYGGDCATTPGAITNAAQYANATMAPSGIQFMMRNRGLSVVSVGDSQMQGFGTVTNQNDPFSIACGLYSTPSFPLTHAKMAYQGMSSASFGANARTFLATNPDVVFFKASSPNDHDNSGAALGFSASYGRFLAFANYCLKRSIVPVAVTEPPFNLTGQTEANRQAYNALIRAGSYMYLDMDVVIADPANPSSPRPMFTSAFLPPHWNDQGAQAMVPLVMAILEKIKAARPK